MTTPQYQHYLIKLLIDAHAAGVEVRYEEGRIKAVCHVEVGEPQREVGRRLRADKLALRAYLAEWDAYVTARLQSEMGTLARYCPGSWKRGAGDHIDEAQEQVEEAARSGNAAAFEHSLYQYGLVVLRSYRDHNRLRGTPLNDDDLLDVVVRLGEPGRHIEMRPGRPRLESSERPLESPETRGRGRPRKKPQGLN